jgi:hypothetical protein
MIRRREHRDAVLSVGGRDRWQGSVERYAAQLVEDF